MQVNVHRERACAHRLVLYTRESTGIANGGQLPHGNLYSTDLPPLLDFSSLEIDTRFSAIFHGVGSLSFSRLLCAFECARTFFNDRRRATPVYHDQRAICGTVDPRINQYRPPALILRQRIFNSATAYRIFMLSAQVVVPPFGYGFSAQLATIFFLHFLSSRVVFETNTTREFNVQPGRSFPIILQRKRESTYIVYLLHIPLSFRLPLHMCTRFLLFLPSSLSFSFSRFVFPPRLFVFSPFPLCVSLPRPFLLPEIHIGIYSPLLFVSPLS